jgi:hypothetical protein
MATYEKLLILYFHPSWLGLSQKTISGYSPFNLQWLFVTYEQSNTSRVLPKNGNAAPTIVEQRVLNTTISQAKDDNQYGWPAFILQEDLKTSSPAAALPPTSSSTWSPTKSSSTSGPAATSLSALSDHERASQGTLRMSLTAEEVPGQRRHGTQIKQYEEEKGQEKEQGMKMWTEWSQEGGDKAKVTEWGYDTGQKILEVTPRKNVMPAKKILKATVQQENSDSEDGKLPISKTTESSFPSSTDGTPVNKIAAETPLYDIGPMSNIPRGNILFLPDVDRSRLNTHSQLEVAMPVEDDRARIEGQAVSNSTFAESLISEENPQKIVCLVS